MKPTHVRATADGCALLAGHAAREARAIRGRQGFDLFGRDECGFESVGRGLRPQVWRERVAAHCHRALDVTGALSCNGTLFKLLLHGRRRRHAARVDGHRRRRQCALLLRRRRQLNLFEQPGDVLNLRALLRRRRRERFIQPRLGRRERFYFLDRHILVDLRLRALRAFLRLAHAHDHVDQLVIQSHRCRRFLRRRDLHLVERGRLNRHAGRRARAGALEQVGNLVVAAAQAFVAGGDRGGGNLRRVGLLLVGGGERLDRAQDVELLLVGRAGRRGLARLRALHGAGDTAQCAAVASPCH